MIVLYFKTVERRVKIFAIEKILFGVIVLWRWIVWE